MKTTTTTLPINGKSTKEEMGSFLKGALSYKNLAKEIKDSINYTLKKLAEDAKAVTKTDLMGLVNDIMASVSPVTPVMETSPKIKSTIKKADPTPNEAPKEEAPKEAPKEEAPKVADKKNTIKKSASKDEAPKAEAPKAKSKITAKTTKEIAPKEAVVTTGKVKGSKELVVINFPDEYEHTDFGTLIKFPCKSVEEIRNAIDEGKQIVIATYWTQRLIKKFNYAESTLTVSPKNGFPDDLDILQVVYACSGVDLMYAISTYTEGMFLFQEDNLTPVKDKTIDGDEFEMKYENDMEFEVYEVVATDVE